MFLLVIPINLIAALHYVPQIDFLVSAYVIQSSMLHLNDHKNIFPSCDSWDKTTMLIHSSMVISIWALLIYVIKKVIIYIQLDPDPFTDALQICVHVLLTIANIQLLSTLAQLPIIYF
jgi:hypothetical protein